MLNELTKALAAVAPITGVSIGRKDDRSTWRIDFAPEATDDQKAQAAQIVASFDIVKVEHNEGVDAQIVAVEFANPMTHRAQREGLYSIALLADLLNAAVAQIEAEIRTIPGHESFTLSRLPNIKATAGMTRIKGADDQIKALRAQRQ